MHRTHYKDHIGSREAGHYKATLFQSDRLLLGMNCLDAGQTQPSHIHSEQDKFYLVMEGVGEFSVGEAQFSAGPGEVVWAPAGSPHGVHNRGPKRLDLIVGIAPSPVR